jgi:hypothetical protein
MTNITANPSHEKAAEHLEALRGYARKSLAGEEPPSRLEWVDKSVRLSEFVTLGNSFKLTVKEMVALILKDVYHQPSQCGCHSCMSRNAQE